MLSLSLKHPVQPCPGWQTIPIILTPPSEWNSGGCSPPVPHVLVWLHHVSCQQRWPFWRYKCPPFSHFNLSQRPTFREPSPHPTLRRHSTPPSPDSKLNQQPLSALIFLQPRPLGILTCLKTLFLVGAQLYKNSCVQTPRFNWSFTWREWVSVMALQRGLTCHAGLQCSRQTSVHTWESQTV